MGAVSGAISFGIGCVATSAFQAAVTTGKALFEAGMHGITAGMMSEIQGGTFASGLASGAVSSLVSSGIQAIGQTGNTLTSVNANGDTIKIAEMTEFSKTAGFKALMLASGGLSGGLSSSIAGGNFFAGVRQGLITSGLNHLAHIAYTDNGEDDPKPTPYKKGYFKKAQEEFSRRVSNIDTNKISNLLNGLGIGTDAKMAVLSLAKGNLTAIGGYLRGMKILGGAIGLGAIGLAVAQYINVPSTANLLGLIGTTATVILAGPIGSFAVGLADVTGVSNYVYGQLGSMIDNIAGYSVGNAVYSNISGMFNPNLVKP